MVEPWLLDRKHALYRPGNIQLKTLARAGSTLAESLVELGWIRHVPTIPREQIPLQHVHATKRPEPNVLHRVGAQALDGAKVFEDWLLSPGPTVQMAG